MNDFRDYHATVRKQPGGRWTLWLKNSLGHGAAAEFDTHTAALAAIAGIRAWLVGPMTPARGPACDKREVGV